MSILVNGEVIALKSYDDEDSLLAKYAVETQKVPPEYITFEDEFQIEDGAQIATFDIREEVKDVELEKMVEELPRIKRKFPKLSEEEIGIIWINENLDLNDPFIEDFISDNIPLLRKIDKRFANQTITRNLVNQYNASLSKRIEQQQIKLDEREKFSKKIESIKPLKIGDYHLEEVTTIQTITVPTGLSLEDIFDIFDVSEELPFIHLVIGEKNWYKVYTHFDVPSVWLDETPEEGIYFKILNVLPENLIGRKEVSKLYSKGVWNKDHTVEINFKVSGRSEEEIKKIFFGAMGDRVPYDTQDEKQLQVRGTFPVRDLSFNRAIFADMVCNNEVMNKFLFFNERTKTVIEKDRFSFYFFTSKLNVNDALTITVTPYVDEDEWIDVRISRATNIQQVQAFQKLFAKFLRLYLDDQQKVMREYAKYLPNAKTLFSKYVKQKKKTKDDKKTGRRLFELKRRHPDVFSSGYATLCEKIRQPYILDPTKVETFKEQYGPHKAMDYKNPITGETSTYVCEPREDDETGTFIYPGLRKNTKKGGSIVPFVPCCFTDDQYTKRGSQLYKEIRGMEDDASYLKESKINTGHILSSSKRLPRARLGETPFYLSFIVQAAGYEDINYGTKTALPILRYGVMEAYDSFLHCMERVFNARYVSMKRTERIKAVRTIRDKMSKMNTAIVRQELYDYTDNDIQDIMGGDGYLDPGMWIRMAEVYYNCNIFIYQVDEQYPDGAVLIPRFSQAHLLRDISESKDTVFIVKYQYEGGKYPYQCELLTKFNPFGTGKDSLQFVFKNDTFVEEAIRILYNSNLVYMLDPDYYSFYPPIDIPEM